MLKSNSCIGRRKYLRLSTARFIDSKRTFPRLVAVKHPSFSLRLPATLLQHAIDLAQLEGISLNEFVMQAIAEKLVGPESIGPPPDTIIPIDEMA